MSNPITNPEILFEPKTVGNFIYCFDAGGSNWLSFMSVERVYAHDEEVYVSTSNGVSLLAARLLTDEQAEQALTFILQALSANEEKENDDN